MTGKSTKSEQEKTLSFDSTNYENILNLAEIHCRLDDSYAFQLLDRKLFNRANDYSGREYPTGSRRSNPHAWLDFRSFGQKTNAQVWDEIGGGASSADNALFVGAFDRDRNSEALVRNEDDAGDILRDRCDFSDQTGLSDHRHIHGQTVLTSTINCASVPPTSIISSNHPSRD